MTLAEASSCPSTSDNFVVGASTASSKFLNAAIDQVRVYNYARSHAQIAWDYNRGRPTSWWTFDECSGTTIRDVAVTATGSASGVNGTWSGATAPNTSAGTCSSGDSSEAWANGNIGRFNHALDFDAIDDVVAINNSALIDLNEGLRQGFTISTWVYADGAGESNVGHIFTKDDTKTFCRTKNPVGSHLDLECSLDLATADATITVGNAFDTGGWHNVVLSWSDDSDDEISVWIDGKLRGASNNGNGSTISENNPLYIGNNSGGSATFNGRIDQVMVFPYEMNAILIRTLYNEFAAVRFGPLSGSP